MTPLNLPPTQGLYRTTVAGAGRSLSDAFDCLEGGSFTARTRRYLSDDSWTTRVSLPPEEGQGYWELTRIRDDLFIILSNFRYGGARVEWVPGDGLLQFNFKLSGDLTYGVELPGPLRFNRPALHLWRQPEGVDMQEWTAPGAFERMVTVCLRPDYLARRFLSGTAAPPRLQTFLGEATRDIAYWELPFTAQMLDLTTKLLKNTYQGSLYVRYKESLAQQLLCDALTLCAHPARSHSSYGERHHRAVELAKRELSEQLADPPIIRTLARRVALPEKALREAFRSIQGESLHDFGLRCRMQRALKRLSEEGAAVDQVATEVGYAHPTSFAHAFFGYFGMRPRDIKLRRN